MRIHSKQPAVRKIRACGRHGDELSSAAVRARLRSVPAALALLPRPVATASTLERRETGHPAVGGTPLTIVDTSRGRTLGTEVWYPAARAGRDAPMRRGRFPLVLIAHGFCGFRTNYEYLATHLA